MVAKVYEIRIAWLQKEIEKAFKAKQWVKYRLLKDNLLHVEAEAYK